MTVPEWVPMPDAVPAWQLVAGLLVLVGAPLLALRAWHRTRPRSLVPGAPGDPEDVERATRERDDRGRRIEDALTLGVAAAAAYLSSTGLRSFGQHHMKLEAPLDWLPFIALDMAAVVCGLRARRRARAGEGPGLSGLLVWLLVAASATFSATEASGAGSAAARAVWPVIAGTLFELGSLEERRSAKDVERRRLGQWLDRKLGAVRLLHPVEWVRVQLALAADESVSQEEATRRVRIDRAGYRLYRLRQLVHSPTEWYHLTRTVRVNRADRRAQVAQARVGTGDLAAVLAANQRRVRTRDMATLTYTSPERAERMLASFITTPAGTVPADTGTPAPAGTARPGTALPAAGTTATALGTTTTGTGTAGAHTAPDTGTAPADRHADTALTGTGTATPGIRTALDTGTAGTGTAAVPVVPVPGPRTDTGTDTARTGPGDTGTGSGLVPDTAQVSTGIHTAPGTDGNPAGTATGTDGGGDGTGEQRGDDDLVTELRHTLREDGSFGTGGKARTGRALRIGTQRASRLMDLARDLGPLPRTGTDTGTASAGTGITGGGSGTDSGAGDTGVGTQTADPAAPEPVPVAVEPGPVPVELDFTKAVPLTVLLSRRPDPDQAPEPVFALTSSAYDRV